MALAQKELDALRNDLNNNTFDDTESTQRLSRLKILAREPAKAPCVYQKDGLSVLAKIAFAPEEHVRKESSLEAARIIANALLLQDRTQQIFADLGHTIELVAFYKQSTADHEFIGARILFLLTYKSNVDFGNLVENHQLVNCLDAHLSSHLSNIAAGNFTKDQMTVMALTETLKLIYNIANKCQAQHDYFTELIPRLISITSTIAIPSEPLNPPIAQLLNALGTIDWPSSLTTESDDLAWLVTFSKRLVDIVDKSILALSTSQLESMLIAPLTILRKVTLLSHKVTNDFLGSTLLPQDEERDKPLGHSQSLAARLLRLQSSAGVMVLPEAISGLLFDLSERDASKFIRNIGYGHAAGYLMTHQIPVPDDLTPDRSNGSTRGSDVPINPVTGQRLDAESTASLPEMTDEEKEREAQRLFVLFERLKATGVVDVQNPMRAAQQSGRFEELSDSDPD